MLITDQHGIDVLQGVGLNRDFAASEEASIVYSGTTVHPQVDDADTLTLKIRDNTVASAAITIDVYFSPGV